MEIRVNEERRLNSGGQREEKSRWQRTPPRICRVRVLGLGDSGWPLYKRERSETGVSLGRQTTDIELKMWDLLQIGKVEVRPQISLPILSKRQMTAKQKARKWLTWKITQSLVAGLHYEINTSGYLSILLDQNIGAVIYIINVSFISFMYFWMFLCKLYFGGLFSMYQFDMTANKKLTKRPLSHLYYIAIGKILSGFIQS